MGNVSFLEGKAYKVAPTYHTDLGNCYGIYIDANKCGCECIYLCKDDPNYVKLLQQVEINKLCKFITKSNIHGARILLSIDDLDIHETRIKIIKFIRLKNLDNTFSIIHDDPNGPSLVTHNIGNFIVDKTYDVKYVYNGTNGCYNIVTFNDVTEDIPNVIENEITWYDQQIMNMTKIVDDVKEKLLL